MSVSMASAEMVTVRRRMPNRTASSTPNSNARPISGSMPEVSCRAIGPSIRAAVMSGSSDCTTMAVVATTSMKIR